MAKRKSKPSTQAWLSDQLTKSGFFHQKLHQYGLLEIADEIERIPGEKFDWNDKTHLGISKAAWDKVIHRGLKPLNVFAHPDVLSKLPGAVAYYRGLSMASQKSMGRIELATTSYEREIEPSLPPQQKAERLAQRFNQLISILLETDDDIDEREFNMWRGMTAGAKADGSWRNNKGERAEELIKTLVINRIKVKGLLLSSNRANTEFDLSDGRKIVFASEPDITILKQGLALNAVEIKGGIDSAGVLERLGAAIKSFSRVKNENPDALTLLIMYKVATSIQAEKEIRSNKRNIDFFMPLEEVLESKEENNRFFGLLRI